MNRIVTHCEVPLCIDLDGTLIRGDLTYESLLVALKMNPLNLFSLFFTLIFKGKAHFKSVIADISELRIDLAPVNQEVLEFAKNSKKEGRKVILVTGSHEKYASRVVSDFEFFDEYISTDESINLIGKNKKEALVKRFGEKGFDYIGDSSVDTHVWESSRKSYFAKGSSKSFSNINFEKIFILKKTKFKSILKSLRVHQWIKNVLIFAPIILAHKIPNSSDIQNLMLSFGGFSLLASSIYVINDLLDIESDRQHSKKKKRPYANGDLSVKFGLLLFVLCCSLGLFISTLVSLEVSTLFLGYFITNLLYSFKLKKLALIDVFLLSSFYLFRLFIGGSAVNVPLSPWFLGFSFFFFLGLGFLKRYCELYKNFKNHGRTESSGRGYSYNDLVLLLTFGVMSSFLSTLVMSQYVFQGQALGLYSKPNFLWLAVAIILFWMCDLWLRASRGKVEDDPVKFISTDKTSIVLICLLGFLFFLAT